MVEIIKEKIPIGLCQCGCGGETKLAVQTSKRDNWRVGQPMRYIMGHARRTNRSRYKYVKAPDHPHANSSGFVYEHIIVAEKALGRYLQEGVQVHHVDEDRTNNKNNNLVICQDDAYHKLLHMRMRALKTCGNPNWLRCRHCSQYSPPEEIAFTTYRQKSGNLCKSYYHPECNKIDCKNRREQRKSS